MQSDKQDKTLMRELIIGVFRRPRAARLALEALREVGFFDNQLGLLSSEALPQHESRPTLGKRVQLQAKHLLELGLPETDMQYYARELARGNSVIVVDPEERTLHALTVLERQTPLERAIFRLAPFVARTERAGAAAMTLQ